jgi:hypothetical protein
MPRLARWSVVTTVVLVACSSRPLQQRDGGDAGSVGVVDADADADTAPRDTMPGDGVVCPSTDGAGTQCANGLDDDGDGLVDALDPDCTSPYDETEELFESSLLDAETCHRDCQFDSNPGQGDDQCGWDPRCDPLAPVPSCGSPSPAACPPVTQHCRDFCLPLTPNGCDCFGCCAVDVAGVRRTVLISERIPCSSQTLSDPARCPSCTQNTDCLNPCLPGEICFAGAAPVGGPTTDLAPRCSQGQIACGAGALPPCLCPAGTYCQTGCCVPFPAEP